MSRIYTRDDYEGVVDDFYRRYPFFSTRADLLTEQFPGRSNQTTLVAGCGWGFLLEELDARGWDDVWGMDASEYATGDRAPSVLPSNLANRVRQGNILSRSDMNDARTLFGRPRLIITEDVLPCMADASEVETALGELRRVLHSQGEMCHIITPRDPDPRGEKQPDGSVVFPWGEQMPGFMWLTGEEWRELIGPGERTFLTGSYEEVL